MNRLLPALLLLFLLGANLWATGPGDNGLSSILENFAPRTSTYSLSAVEVQALFNLAALNHWNVFDLLDEAGLYLVAKGVRVTVTGDQLRDLEATYRMGDHRVDTLLPLPEVVSLSLGARNGTDSEMEVILSRPVSGFLELGDFALETKYGFTSVKEKNLDGAFGVSVKNGLFAGKLQKIARVPDPTGHNDPNFIAIYIDNLFRPKRWQIDPVQFRTGPTPKP